MKDSKDFLGLGVEAGGKRVWFGGGGPSGTWAALIIILMLLGGRAIGFW